jgi:hypothetical protein
MKQETIISLAPSSLRKIANYVLLFVGIEREYAREHNENRPSLDRIEASAKTILRDTSKRRLTLPKVKQ